jgi:hypothetical protein
MTMAPKEELTMTTHDTDAARFGGPDYWPGEPG